MHETDNNEKREKRNGELRDQAGANLEQNNKIEEKSILNNGTT